MRPGCCCTPKAKVSTLSQATCHLQPTFILILISISSTIRYYPEICRRYSAPTNPSVTIICFRYRSTEPAMAAPASIGHSRIRYCKCRARLGPGPALGGVRWSHGAGSPSVATCPQPRMEHAAHTASGGCRVIVGHFTVVNVSNSVSCVWKQCC